MGRPSLYTEELADAIADRLASGESMATICESDDMPSLRTAMRWAAEHKDFGTIYAHARAAQAEVMDQKVLAAADKATAENAAAVRVQIDAYKWRAARLNPKAYGDTTTLKHADADGGKIELDPVARATRLAAIFADIEKAKGDNVTD